MDDSGIVIDAQRRGLYTEYDEDTEQRRGIYTEYDEDAERRRGIYTEYDEDPEEDDNNEFDDDDDNEPMNITQVNQSNSEYLATHGVVPDIRHQRNIGDETEEFKPKVVNGDSRWTSDSLYHQRNNLIHHDSKTGETPRHPSDVTYPPKVDCNIPLDTPHVTGSELVSERQRAYFVTPKKARRIFEHYETLRHDEGGVGNATVPEDQCHPRSSPLSDTIAEESSENFFPSPRQGGVDGKQSSPAVGLVASDGQTSGSPFDQFSLRNEDAHELSFSSTEYSYRKGLVENIPNFSDDVSGNVFVNRQVTNVRQERNNQMSRSMSGDDVPVLNSGFNTADQTTRRPSGPDVIGPSADGFNSADQTTSRPSGPDVIEPSADGFSCHLCEYVCMSSNSSHCINSLYNFFIK